MINEAIKDNPSFLELRKIEAAREISKLVAKSGNRIYIPTENLLLDLQSKQSNSVD